MAYVKVCYAFLELDEPIRITATQLRGYVGYLFIEDTEFHHHMDNPYHYPLIQYKKVKNKPMIMGFGEYADILFRKVSSLEKILVSGADNAKVRSVELKQEVVAIEKKPANYRFVSPWIALNERNHRIFVGADYHGKSELLKKILAANILSMLKGLKVFVDFRISIDEVKHTAPFLTRAHGNTFWGFRPEFTANISLPRYAGLGKSVSKGFGTVDIIDS
ncbi:MAG: CRISPR-associated endonuclease Cas6 [Nitrososphaerales archaeon]